MREYKDKLGRSIWVYENVFTTAYCEELYSFISHSLYTIGFEDTSVIERRDKMYIVSSYNDVDMANCKFMQELKKTEAWDKVKNLSLRRATVNLSVPTNTHYSHTHADEISLIYYVNLDWKQEWAGETLFYSDDMQEIIHASIYKPNKLILFDGSIPHAIRPQNIEAPTYRFSLALFFKKNKQEKQ